VSAYCHRCGSYSPVITGLRSETEGVLDIFHACSGDLGRVTITDEVVSERGNDIDLEFFAGEPQS